ncbi:hypothetical protein HYH02_011302 [Chlamydomonas schloesseri]|uniref:Magnesium transporter n=1 Tax=Chlamydomonas schloesseri TaxID=2026947 RepID=A0A835W4R1_9CHLO|nr:hypothetical protein HYH02_011302 [Chlamydomonas schloesseri]|eukprot:KAG2437039.1 hypothetical protein HYH02_011302 [Chlamydomonas schloesseri]
MRRSGRTPVGGVRFAADEPEDGSAIAITLGDAAAVGAPLEQLLAAAGAGAAGGSNGTPGVAPGGSATRASPARGGTPLPLDEGEGGPEEEGRGRGSDAVGRLHLGGLQLLHDTQQDESHDEGGYGGMHSRNDSDADGPLDGGGGGIGGGIGGGLDHGDGDGGGGGGRRSVRRQATADGFHSGDEERGPDAAALAGGGSNGGGVGVSGGGGGGPGGGGGGGGGRRHHRALSGKPGKSGKSGKQSVMRTWLRIDRNGETSLLQADKWRITHKLGIQTRDLRLLDPNLSTTYPSAILCRDKAIVVNLEHLKAIITTSFVLVVNPEDEKVVRFINELKGRLSTAATAGGMPQSRSFQALTDAERLKLAPGPSTLGVDLPFELKALEVCLDVMAGHLDFLTQELEASAYPALDALANKVSSPHLERVRRIKNNLVRLTTRVETVREVLEKFLDDDSDMHEMNLTAKELHEIEERRQLEQANNVDAHSTVSTTGSRSSGSSSSASSDSSVEEAETAVVEMLLETYFMHVDNTYNKLQTLHEYIGDTEDLVNIKLDQHRNQLITIDLILTALTTVLAMMTVVGAWFGMNLDSGLQEAPGVFNQVAVGSSVIGVGLLLLFVFWLWRAKLIIY